MQQIREVRLSGAVCGFSDFISKSAPSRDVQARERDLSRKVSGGGDPRAPQRLPCLGQVPQASLDVCEKGHEVRPVRPQAGVRRRFEDRRGTRQLTAQLEGVGVASGDRSAGLTPVLGSR